MIKFLEEYCNRLFPSVDTEIKNAVRHEVDQRDMTKSPWFMLNQLDVLSQGDILDKIPFLYMKDDGSKKAYVGKGMVLSNTCDLQRDPYIIIAPLFNMDDETEKKFSEQTKKDLKDNVVTAKMGFKNSRLDNYFVDFSKSMSFNRNIILKGIEMQKIRIEESLTQYACYMLYIKLTIYYMRVENHEHFETRDRGI